MSQKGTTPFQEFARKRMRIENSYIKEAISEFLASLIVCVFAVAAVTQHILQPGNDSMQPALGGVLGLMIAILVCGGISGPHLNPAVTLGLAIAGHLSWAKVPVYFVAQIFGGFVGAGLAAANYYWVGHGKFTEVIPAGAFAHITTETPVANGILDQTIGTAILLMTVLAVIDKRNMEVPKHLIPLYLALTVAALLFCFGYNSGSPLNPARDLGPRLMAIAIGYSVDEVFTPGGQQWWTVGFFGPLIGGAIGSVMYIVLIGAHLKDTEEEALEKKNTQFSSQFQPQRQPSQMYQSGGPVFNGGSNMQRNQGRNGPSNYPYDMNGNMSPNQYQFRGGANTKSYA
ncbi:unnamed protein product [Allacma fusca]|uniref:Aquaporin n=1 Tax=Allacma fusca TaxID=39272 RepID=A0A8J2KT02_9HEXA|nr:unnamed protein product [Allacma fusca]